jgi:hypothetical protein
LFVVVDRIEAVLPRAAEYGDRGVSAHRLIVHHPSWSVLPPRIELVRVGPRISADVGRSFPRKHLLNGLGDSFRVVGLTTASAKDERYEQRSDPRTNSHAWLKSKRWAKPAQPQAPYFFFTIFLTDRLAGLAT